MELIAEMERKYAGMAYDLVSETLGIMDLSSKVRSRNINDARKIFIFVCDIMSIRDEVIGAYINRDRTTVIHHRYDALDLMRGDKEFAEKLSRCEEGLFDVFNGRPPVIKYPKNIKERRFGYLTAQLNNIVPIGYEKFFEIKIAELVNSLKEQYGLRGIIKVKPHKFCNERAARCAKLPVRRMG